MAKREAFAVDELFDPGELSGALLVFAVSVLFPQASGFLFPPFKNGLLLFAAYKNGFLSPALLKNGFLTLEEAAVCAGVFSSGFFGDAVLLPKSEFYELLFSFKKPKLASGFFTSVYENSPILGFLSSYFGAGVSVFFNNGCLNKLSDLAEVLKSPGYFLSSGSIVYFLSFPKAGDSLRIFAASGLGDLPNKPAPSVGLTGALSAPNNDLDSLFAPSNLFLETN